MGGLASAAGLVGFLSEPDPDLQVYALQQADDGMSLLWTELASAVSQIEALYEDPSFPERELASLVAAKIYYHLQEYDESMVFALGAGKLFDIDKEGEFEETIIAKCIDAYVAMSASDNESSKSSESDQQLPQLSTALSHSADGSANVSASQTSPVTPFSQSALPSKSLLSRQDSSAVETSSDNAPMNGAPIGPTGLQPATRKSLQAIIRRIFERCFQEGAYRQVVGIAVEARNLGILKETIARATQDGEKALKARGRAQGGRREELMDYLLDICMNVVQERGLRNEILQLILDLLISSDTASPDNFSIAKCIVYLGQHVMASKLLKDLVDQESSRSAAVAYQTSFDLYDNGTQDFLSKVLDGLPQTEESESEFSIGNSQTAQPNVQEDAQESDQLLSNSTAGSTTMPTRPKPSDLSEDKRKVYSSIREILTGTKSLELNLEFLFRSNKSDRQVLTKLKNSLEARNSIFHSAVSFANGFTNAGTTSDWFVRENLDWLNKAVNWSKFTVGASLGVIHRGNIGQGRKLLEPYLRDSSTGGSSYSKGGALFGLGLIYTNHGKHVLNYLFDQLTKAASEEVVQHGAALGLGVAGMASESERVVDELKNALWSNSAISGQAAGLGMGLVLLGSGNVRALEEMINYAHETEHDKIVRGISMGMSMIMYARQEAADELINGLLEDPDPTLRYGGVLTIAMAYCGTSSNKAVRKLLHIAVSDVNDDVRRMSVMSLGFVLFRKPHSVPRMVELLAESYNPHVRYGATMALGIACAGTGLDEAIDLLEPMMKDSTDFVRQGTSIALAMILVQQTEAMSPKVVTIRKHFVKVVSDRHEDAMAKFGAAIALGIIDAGGRNCSLSLQTQTGNPNMSAIVGMAVFTQYWYWFPFAHFLSLALMPTAVIGVDQDLEVPQLKLNCAARPNLFDYPPPLEVKTEEAPEKVKTAVLSTTAQAKRRKLAQQRKYDKGSGMEIDQPTPETPKVGAADDDKMDVDEPSKESEEDKAAAAPGEGKSKEGESGHSSKPPTAKQKMEKEKVGFELENMSRVLPAQLRYTSFPDGRYTPVKKPTGGVTILLDNQPSEPKSLIERKVKRPVAAPATNAPAQSQQSQVPRTPVAQTAQPQAQQAEQQGRDDAAAVLNAVDEDDQDGVEAELPREFDYESDGEGGGSD